DSEMVWCQKGWAEMKLEDYKAAVISFRHALEFNPDDAWNWGQYAKCCNKIGKFSEAEKAAERVLELDPSSSVAQRELRQALSSKEPRPILFE
ncbi:MAG: tetratricopeptide repeat protein, partial [Candidatus Hodarchaeales archaeon]